MAPYKSVYYIIIIIADMTTHKKQQQHKTYSAVDDISQSSLAMAK